MVLSLLGTALPVQKLGGWLGGFLDRRWAGPPNVRYYKECFKMLTGTTDLGSAIDLW